MNISCLFQEAERAACASVCDYDYDYDYGKYGSLAPGLLFSRLFKTLSVFIVYIDTI